NKDFSYAVRYIHDNKTLVEFGSVSAQILSRMDIEKEVFYANFDWDLIMGMLRNNAITYREISKFPSVRRDLSMLLDKAVSFEKLKQISNNVHQDILKEIHVFDVYEGNPEAGEAAKIPAGKKSYALSFIFQD